MDATPQPNGLRGLDLLAAHLRSLDPEARPAQLRLDEALGEPLARRLLGALAPGGRGRRAA